MFNRIVVTWFEVVRGHSTTTWTEFCHFLTPPPCVHSLYTLNVDKDRHFLTPHLVHLVIECPLIDNEFKVIIPWSVFFSFFLCDHEQEIAIAIYSARARGILNNYCGFCLQTNWNEIFSLPIITSLCWSFVARIFFSNYRMKKMPYFVGKWSSALINNWSEVH